MFGLKDSIDFFTIFFICKKNIFRPKVRSNFGHSKGVHILYSQSDPIIHWDLKLDNIMMDNIHKSCITLVAKDILFNECLK
jgi:hypothetical protein